MRLELYLAEVCTKMRADLKAILATGRIEVANPFRPICRNHPQNPQPTVLDPLLGTVAGMARRAFGYI